MAQINAIKVTFDLDFVKYKRIVVHEDLLLLANDIEITQRFVNAGASTSDPTFTVAPPSRSTMGTTGRRGVGVAA